MADKTPFGLTPEQEEQVGAAGRTFQGAGIAAPRSATHNDLHRVSHTDNSLDSIPEKTQREMATSAFKEKMQMDKIDVVQGKSVDPASSLSPSIGREPIAMDAPDPGSGRR